MPTPPAASSSSSSSSSSTAAASVGPPGWLASVPPVPEGTQLKPSRFIDAAKKGQDELLEEFWTDPEKSIDINKIDPIYMVRVARSCLCVCVSGCATTDSEPQTALHWAARGGHHATGRARARV